MRPIHVVVGTLLVLSLPVLAFELAVQRLVRELPRPPLVEHPAPALFVDALWLVDDGPPAKGVEFWWLGNIMKRPAGSAACLALARHLIGRPMAGPYRNVERQVRELALGVWLCRHETVGELKQQLAQESYFGREAVGPRAAATAYFDKPLEGLTVAETAILAGLPRHPAVAENPVRLRARRDYVLAKMQRAGLISAADEVAAQNASPDLKPPPRIR